MMEEDPSELIAELENNLVCFALEKNTPLMNASFQDELQSVFPCIMAKREDYTYELEENCYFKNIPKEFIAKISIEELNMMYQPLMESSCSCLSSLSSSKDNSDHKAIMPIYNLKDYIISIESIILREDNRTMIVMRNIPRDYTSISLFKEISENFYGKFNYFFLPYSNDTKKNNGYALINFTHPLHLISFYDQYHKKNLNHHLSKKKLNVFYSRFTFPGDEVKVSHSDACNSRYWKLFKRIYRHSLCCIKERNYCDDGFFIVKLLKLS